MNDKKFMMDWRKMSLGRSLRSKSKRPLDENFKKNGFNGDSLDIFSKRVTPADWF